MTDPTKMKVLIANRGEIAVRLVQACQSLGFHTTAIYSDEDGGTLAVRMADEAVALKETGNKGYLNSDKIVSICVGHNIRIVIPGYGFLSENGHFAESLYKQGIVFAGPSPQTIAEFGLKHTAREIAVKAGVPVVPGSAMINSKDEAIKQAEIIGYPIMVKATAGGGGMGLVSCRDSDGLLAAVDTVRSRGETLFKDSGLFLEKYVANARHVEAQVFGNGHGDVVWLGERECSIQRRHQKVLEETPSPFVSAHPGLREKIRTASLALAKSVNYKSAGTIEFLVDDDSGEFYFLEMNTRLQVEHGVTELAYNVDIVQLMLLQAQSEAENNGHGLQAKDILRYEPSTDEPTLHSIEVRVYAENPADDYKPAPGLFTDVSFPVGKGIRIDTWLERGSLVTPYFDPLLAKIMVCGSSRDEALLMLESVLSQTVLCGPPTNLELLQAIVASSAVRSGHTLTSMLDSFQFEPSIIEFLDGGLYTTVQDYPGRPNQKSGVPVSGAMDSVSLRLANLLVGNEQGTAAFEITHSGPTIVFHNDCVISLCGAEFQFTIGGQAAQMWTRYKVSKGSKVTIGTCTSNGCRSYLALRGGLPNVGSYLGSKSTTPSLRWGGYQGRTLRTGDVLQISSDTREISDKLERYTLPQELVPTIDTTSRILALPGPYHSDEFLTTRGGQLLYENTYKVAFSSGRGGIRLDGPTPEWSRVSGGEGGSHPSNVLGYGYPTGGLSFTGDSAVIFAADSPVQSGFISVLTVLGCEMPRLGQLKPGDEVRFAPCTWSEGRQREMAVEQLIIRASEAIQGNCKAEGTSLQAIQASPCSKPPMSSTLYEREAHGGLPRFLIRQAGDRGLLCDFGSQCFDLRVRVRAQQLVEKMRDQPPFGFHPVTRPHTMSVFVAYDPDVLSQSDAVTALIELESSLSASITCHGTTYRLPMVFDAEENKVATKRYMETQRPYATYLPDNIDFIRRNNGLETREDVFNCVNQTPFLVIASTGLMGLPILVQIDPRKRFTVPKTNPSRTVTPAGALGTGGNTSAIYPVESPGGYMLWGITLPGLPFDMFGRKPGYSTDRPWLFEPFDQVIFENVTRAEFDEISRLYQSGLYELKTKKSTFEIAEYNALVEKIRPEIDEMQRQQQLAAQVELDRENELLVQWKSELDAKKQSTTANHDTSTLKNGDIDPKLVRVTANMNARIWKVKTEVGENVEPGAVLAVLEAMKMEFPICAPPYPSADANGFRVKLVFKSEGDLVEPGDLLFGLELIEE